MDPNGELAEGKGLARLFPLVGHVFIKEAKLKRKHDKV